MGQRTAEASGISAVSAILPSFNNGYLDIFDGTAPATADTPITTQVRLASLRFASPAFGAPFAVFTGQWFIQALANFLTPDLDADASGTAAWYRAFRSDHTTVIQDGDCVSPPAVVGNLILDPTTSILIHQKIGMTAMSILFPLAS